MFREESDRWIGGWAMAEPWGDDPFDLIVYQTKPGFRHVDHMPIDPRRWFMAEFVDVLPSADHRTATVRARFPFVLPIPV